MSDQLLETHVATLPAGDEDVYFARGVPRKKRKQWSEDLTYSQLVMAFCLTLFLPMLFVTQFSSLSPLYCTLMVMAPCALLLSYRRLYWLVAMAARCTKLPRYHDEESRLRCVGFPEALAKYGTLSPQPFEPAIFNASVTQLSLWRRGPRVFFYVVLAVAIGAWFLCFHAFGRGNAVIELALALLAAPGVARLATALVWRTRIKVAPGRLEIIQEPRFGGGSPWGVCYELRDVRVLVDLPAAYICLEWPDNPAWVLELHTRVIAGSDRLAHTVLRAVVCNDVESSDATAVSDSQTT